MGKDCKTQLAACQAALNPSEEPLDATSAMYAILALGGCALILRMWPKGAPDSVALLLFFVFWYVGNAFYNQYNTLALSAVGGKYGGLTMTVSTMRFRPTVSVSTLGVSGPLPKRAEIPVSTTRAPPRMRRVRLLELMVRG